MRDFATVPVVRAGNLGTVEGDDGILESVGDRSDLVGEHGNCRGTRESSVAESPSAPSGERRWRKAARRLWDAALDCGMK